MYVNSLSTELCVCQFNCGTLELAVLLLLIQLYLWDSKRIVLSWINGYSETDIFVGSMDMARSVWVIRLQIVYWIKISAGYTVEFKPN